jgi:bidirectional [NiFe] hydrogenase diaphorase subunit
MRVDTKKPAPPSTDKRWKLVDAAMRRNGYQPHGLIEALHQVQESFGYVDEEALQYLSDCLHVPPSAVYGVTTFYHHFAMKPQGKHTCVICIGTACHVKGNDRVLEYVQNEFGVKVGATTSDGEMSLMAARCVGACGLAPVVILDGGVVGKLNDTDMKAKIKNWISQEKQPA